MTNRSAVVTGASTGIGYATVQRLAAAGWHVWGGVRSQSDSFHIEQDGINLTIFKTILKIKKMTQKI